MKLTMILTLASIIIASFAFAEVEAQYPDQQSSRAEAKRALQQKSVTGVVSEATKSADFDKSKLLRCWQYGELIVAENGWDAIPANSVAIMTKASEKILVYEFGETFCMYLGD